MEELPCAFCEIRAQKSDRSRGEEGRSLSFYNG